MFCSNIPSVVFWLFWCLLTVDTGCLSQMKPGFQSYRPQSHPPLNVTVLMWHTERKAQRKSLIMESFGALYLQLQQFAHEKNNQLDFNSSVTPNCSWICRFLSAAAVFERLWVSGKSQCSLVSRQHTDSYDCLKCLKLWEHLQTV